MGRTVLNRMERNLAIRALEVAVEETPNWPSRNTSMASKIRDGGTQPGAGPGWTCHAFVPPQVHV
ncbi:hypothetical protein [Epibacterium ulvae]|uniref:hypothetical protein n=1 Tax=Epibacterium ulvae TaxID=1156985 RepID=UPI002491D1C9|nr:hypothetical protein [Epibacterium ulvae]